MSPLTSTWNPQKVVLEDGFLLDMAMYVYSYVKKQYIYIYHSINIITCVFHVKITVYRSTYQVLPGFSSSQISRHMSPQWSRTRCQATHASKSVRKCPGMPWGEAEGPTKPCKPCTLWLFNSLPWKIHPFLNHLFLWAMA